MIGANGTGHPGANGHGNGHAAGIWDSDDNPNLPPDPKPTPDPKPGGKTSPWRHPSEPAETLDFARLADNPAFTREWGVNDWFPMLETTGFGGPGGEGKTLLAHMLATAGAIGHSWLEMPVEEMKTALILCEDRHDDAYLRQADINRHYGCKMADLAGRLLVMPRRRNLHNYLGIFDQDGELHTTTFFDQLLGDLKTFGARLTVLDGRTDIFWGNQNDERHARMFVRQISDRIAEETEGLVLMIYQPSRAGRFDGSGESGSAQWDAAYRCRTYLGPAEKDEDSKIRHLHRKKSNFSPRDGEIAIQWDQGVFIRSDALDAATSPIEIAARMAKAERVFMAMLARFTKANQNVSHSPGPNYAPKLFSADVELAEGCTKDDLAAAMHSLMIKTNMITTAKSGRSSKLAKVE